MASQSTPPDSLSSTSNARTLRGRALCHIGGTASARARFTIPVGADPAITRMMELLHSNSGSIHSILRKAGAYKRILGHIRAGRCPSIHMIRAILNAMGYDLHVVRRPPCP